MLFWGVHVAALAGVIACGWSWRGAALALGTYFVRMVIVTAGYHRYFSHRAFKTSRTFQLLLAVAAESAGQGGVLWWASHHRWHHRTADTAHDVHSPGRHGFWYAHVGWLLANDWRTDLTQVSDLAKYPELRLLNRVSAHVLCTAALALAFLLVGGGPALVWGYMVSTVLLWHGSFAINSLAHLYGNRPYDTSDGSRNNWLLALLTSGEGWHNNHHRYPSAANQGFHWWQIDVTFLCLRVLEWLGLIWELRRPPAGLIGPRADSHASPRGTG
jgi:stearoyl-CoA desaturase (delta-9 desaturase)